MSIQVQHRRGTTAEVEGVTPAAGELGYDTQKKEIVIGDAATVGGIRMAKKNVFEVLMPAQIAANQNNYSPTNLKHANEVWLTSDAARDITGLVPLTVADTTDGREVILYNGGSFSITLKDQSASSTAANRFDLNSADVVLSPKTSATMRYNNTAQRWHLIASTSGSGVGAGAVTAATLAASSQGFSLINGKLVESHAGNALTIAIKTLAGNDPSSGSPVLVLFRDVTLGDGSYTVLSLTAATSLTVSSGSSLGSTNASAFRLWIGGFNDAGTFRLGVINALRGTSSIPVLMPDTVAGSTAEGGAGAADSFGVFYTGTAVTSKPYAILGYFDYASGLTTAGTWDASPSTIQLYHSAIELPGREVAAQIRRQGVALVNGSIVPSAAGNALTIAIKTLAGNDPSAGDPVYVVMRNATAATGDLSIMTLTAATSIVVSSGSTLGTSNSTAFRLWLVGFNDAGTFRPGVINCLSGTHIYPLGGWGIASSTAEGGAGAADSAHIFYTGTAVTSKPYTVLGYLTFESGLATAGTWSAGPTRVQLYGVGVKLPGDSVQTRANESGAFVSSSSAIPSDDTIPQIGEGAEALTVAITPTSAANLMRVSSVSAIAISAAGSIVTAMFVDSVADAFAVAIAYVDIANGGSPIAMQKHLLAGVTSQRTYRLRFGPSAGTGYFNGWGGARKFGDMSNSYIMAEELMA